jgi:hypothetical protein
MWHSACFVEDNCSLWACERGYSVKKHLLAALSVSVIASASVAHASAVITVSELGVASANTVNTSVLGAGVSSITNIIDAPTVLGSTIVANNGGTGIGWNPYGNSNTTAYWLSIGGASSGSYSAATFNFTNSVGALAFDWGSSSVTNTVTLWSGLNGTGTVLGTVSADGGANLFVNGTFALNSADLDNQQIPGAIIKISSSQSFQSAVFSTDANSGGFEIGPVSAVPLPGALSLFGMGLAGLGVLGGWRKARRKTV